MIKAVVFDFGGVMTTCATPVRVREIVEANGLPWQAVLDGFKNHRRAYDIGDITVKEFYARTWRDAGVTVADEVQSEIERADTTSFLHGNPQTLAWMRALKAGGCKIGILTNMPHELAPHFKEYFADFIALADTMVISSEVHLVKPMREIYDRVREGLGVAADEICFIDDSEMNCRGAEEAGWHAIRFESVEQAKKVLGERVEGLGFRVDGEDEVEKRGGGGQRNLSVLHSSLITHHSSLKTVVVTGGTKRLGLAIAERLRADGWRVLTSSHRADAGADIVVDLAEPMGAARLYAAALQANGGNPPDALVNNAALFTGEDAMLEQLNFIAPQKLTMLMAGRENGRGAVVNVLDCRVLEKFERFEGFEKFEKLGNCPNVQTSKRPNIQTSKHSDAYAESKLALLDYTKKSAAMFADTLRVNAVAPGPVLAPTDVHEKAGETPLGRPTPEAVADAVAWLLSAEHTTGCVIPVDGGASVVDSAASPCACPTSAFPRG